MFKALLPGLWHDLSDVKLAEALDDRRRFCGFAESEAVPERTAFVRFRRELVRRRLEGPLFRAVVRRLEGRGLGVKTGTLIDATVIRAASADAGEAGWNVCGRGGPAKGYKAHVAADEAGGIVRRVAVTPANAAELAGVAPVPGRHPGRVFADAAYDSGKLGARVRRRGGEPLIARHVRRRSRPALNAARRAWNAAVGRVRARIEKIFGTAKRGYGLARGRYPGRRRVSLQVHPSFLACTLKRAAAPPRVESA